MDGGVAWSGICEDYLGFKGDSRSLRRLVKNAIEQPWNLAELTGSFSVCAWDFGTGAVAVLTGATQHQTLWRTTGPWGWAVGSRSKTVLELVGHSFQLDEQEASVFLVYKYLVGKGALYKNITRISGRQQIRLDPNKSPKQIVYQTLGDYLGQPTVANFDEAVDLCAETLKKRVARQLQVSGKPILYLTGGRDSRCIAAALHHARFSGPALTGGSPTSLDVKLASRVAQSVGFPHITEDGVNSIDLLARLAQSRERARLWTKLSEGVETIRHGLHYIEFFDNHAPFPNVVTQSLNGHHSGLGKLGVASYTPEKLNKTIGLHLNFHAAVIERFEQMRQHIKAELQALGLPDSRWSELYLWQIDALQWGQDNLLVKDVFNWHWTPLFDKTLIQIGWHLPETYHNSMRFIEAITVRLAPQLARLSYDTAATPPDSNRFKQTLASVRRKMPRLINHSIKGALLEKKRGASLWEEVLWNAPHTHWKDLISETYVREAIAKKHPEEVLWNTITVQLFIETL